MRTLVLIGFLFASLPLLAQIDSDTSVSLSRGDTFSPFQIDSFNGEASIAQEAIARIDSLSLSRVDSSLFYLQRNALSRSLSRKYADLDSTLANSIQSVRMLKDSAAERFTIDDRLIHSPIGQTLLPSVKDQPLLKESSLPTLRRLTPQLPTMSQPINAVPQNAAIWKEKLATLPTVLSQYKENALPYTVPLKQGGEALEQHVLQRVPEGNLLKDNESKLFDLNKYRTQDEEQRTKLKRKMIALAKSNLTKRNSTVQKAQQQLGKLKRKYNMVQGAKRRKRSSLQDVSLSKRLVYGGTMQFQRTPSFSIDLAPQLAYRFNKRISSGVGVVYRLAPEGGLKQLRQQLNSNKVVYGGRLYSEYEVVRSLLLHGEYERLSQGVAATDEQPGRRWWQTSLLAGVGKTYQIAGKWQGSVLLLYNFRHQQQEIHTRPWVVRFGFQRVSSK